MNHQKNKGKNLCKRIVLELRSPVHVGSGEELKNNFDFILKNSRPFVADIKRTLDSIQTNDSRLNSYYSSANLEDLIKIAGREYGYDLPHFPGVLASQSDEANPPSQAPPAAKQRTGSGMVRMPVRKSFNSKQLSGKNSFGGGNTSRSSEIKTVREQLKDAFFRPFIPGSSLKGAIRTAIWTEALLENESHVEKILEKNKNPEDIVFGFNPQKDLMRSFHVSDGYFELNHLRLGDVRWANVCNDKEREAEQKIKWRDLKQSKKSLQKNQSSWRQAKGVYIEALAPEAKAEFVFSWDGFLLDDFSHWSPDTPCKKLLRKPPQNFQDLKETLNRHALRIIENEKGFFEKYGLPEVCEFYSELKEEIEKTKNESAWLRLGWSCGWTGMTGLTESFLSKNKIRERVYKINNAREGVIYPKTRRLLVQNGSPRLPLGWAKIYLSDGSAQNPYRKSSAASSAASFGKKTGPSSGFSQDSVNCPNRSFSPWLSEKISEISDKHKIKNADEALKGKPLAQEWQKLSEGEKKQKIQKEIIDIWKERGWWDEPQGRGQKKAKEIYQPS